ncbi:MAG: trypsin-like serine protease [Rhodanobacter sp.]
MKLLRLSTLVLALVPAIALAIVIHPGVPDSKYLVPDSAFPALVDLPGEGQGVLIAPRWAVTAAHATQGYMLMRVKIHGEWRNVSHVFLYPGFKKEYDKVKLAAEHPTLKNWPTLKAAFASMHDIALIELAKPVEDVKPAALYLAANEQGKIVKLFGKGATGNGNVGQYPHSPHRGQLRRAYNRVTSAHEQWLSYRFDCGPEALPLEGVIGDGDSGGPVLIQANGEWKLAGLADWKHWPKGHPKFVPGVCGQVFSNSRISYYAKWINRTMAAHSSQAKSADAG